MYLVEQSEVLCPIMQKIPLPFPSDFKNYISGNIKIFFSEQQNTVQLPEILMAFSISYFSYILLPSEWNNNLDCMYIHRGAFLWMCVTN